MSILYKNKEPSSAATYPLKWWAHLVHKRLGMQVERSRYAESMSGGRER